MTYDNYGNIQTKNGVSYTYGDANWKDKLTAYDGQGISYDAGGNPLSYRGWTFTWEKGRQLKTASNGSDSIAFTYNANGVRTSKTINGVRHDYILDGIKILRETYGTTVLNYLYDNEDSVCGLKYNGTPYYFYKNLQGDVIAIKNTNDTVVARYSYDAWGVCSIDSDTSGVSISTKNLFKYRSYYFDSETALYYLQSRYYVDTVGRNKKVIEQYIRNQLQEDVAAEQLSIKEYIDPFTGEPVKEGKK